MYQISGPEGVLSGLYREGHGTSCVPFMDRFVTCAQVKITPSHEKQIVRIALKSTDCQPLLLTNLVNLFFYLVIAK